MHTGAVDSCINLYIYLYNCHVGLLKTPLIWMEYGNVRNKFAIANWHMTANAGITRNGVLI